MDLIALARARQALLRVGIVLIMVGAMIVGTAPGDWLAQCMWIAAYASVAVGAAVIALSPAGKLISGPRWRVATAITDIVALSGFHLLTTGGYVPLLLVGLLPLMVIVEVSWRRAAVILGLSVVAFIGTLVADTSIPAQIGWPAAWFLVALYAYLCCAAFLATYVQARQIDEVTTQRTANEYFAHLATHDALTGLPNRAYVLARISDAVTRDGGGALSAALFIDLDRFKDINDSLGHEAGDTVLRTAAERLQRAVRPDDLVARLGGDEFVALLFGPTTSDVLDHVCERLHAALAAPIRIGDTAVNVTASIGIAPVGEHDERDGAAILNDADFAMYAAKAVGRGESRYASGLPDVTEELLDVN
ncbi:GGDEF domain-containing protein [Mycobacterium sp. RTGN5]|uniref:GGDEF domain-containing protein n=1 Tax=Mycobacterium sp. RTGN5 TaxID=3016522 RepID=UPI0029C7380D|nr:GGDEF domain-containing protein [Mycobacterium sp. RTGN5]